MAWPAAVLPCFISRFLYRPQLCHGHCLGRTQLSELIENGYADVELGNLSLKRSGHHLLAQALEAIYLRLHQ